MSNLELARAARPDSKIKIYGADAFDGMRRAGQLTARV
ncbi:MAG TPA: type I methionyl aminopeptidase, partial [Rhizobiales bacterium]|nr:type I methionyl aminopeptidase [Hyphomicrobiales bacterium]